MEFDGIDDIYQSQTSVKKNDILSSLQRYIASFTLL